MDTDGGFDDLDVGVNGCGKENNSKGIAGTIDANPRFDDTSIKYLVKSRIDRDAPDVRVSTDAANAVAEYMRLFVVETVQRCVAVAAEEADAERETDGADCGDDDEMLTVEPTHLEKVLPQLLLDFF